MKQFQQNVNDNIVKLQQKLDFHSESAARYHLIKMRPNNVKTTDHQAVKMKQSASLCMSAQVIGPTTLD